MPDEYRIVCGAAPGSGKAEYLSLAVNDAVVEAQIRVSNLSRKLVAELPPILSDLLEVAAFVYAADAAISRGGSTARQAGADWRRDLRFVVPVRCIDIWSRPGITRQLCRMLAFLSDDQYRFTFTAHHGLPIEATIPFSFGPEEGWCADEVIMFSGGLDSFAGAAEAVIERRARVALVSHYSSNVMAAAQKKLAKALADVRETQDLVRHFPVKATLRTGQTREATHRPRSFLFASLGLAVAQGFGRRQVDFYENGIVSLNLPLLAQFVGTRATRSTHPEALTAMAALFSALLDQEIAIRNPFFLRTKRDVVRRIADLGLAERIKDTRSCAKVRTASKMLPHCGCCSQCIDRRFAVLSAGLAESDPAEAYAVDLLDGPRYGADRELALAYVRHARACRSMTPAHLLRQSPEVTRALDQLGLSPASALSTITDLLKRHGQGVTQVMETAMQLQPREDNALRALYAADDLMIPETQPQAGAEAERRVLIEIDMKRRRARIDGGLTIEATRFLTLLTLAEAHWRSLGDGRAPEDFETLRARQLLESWDLTDESSVRRRIEALRRGLSEDVADIVETLTWHGYRLRPERVTVRKAELA